MSAEQDRELWEALVEAEREHVQRRANFYNKTQDRTRVLKRALDGTPWQQATALSFLRDFPADSLALLPQLVELTLSHRWALAARQAIDRIPRDRLWPVLTPVLGAKMATTDPDDLRRLAELLAHINALPLLEKLIARACRIDDPEARELADDFTDQYRLFWTAPSEPGSNP